jgi:hypothetical protein
VNWPCPFGRRRGPAIRRRDASCRPWSGFQLVAERQNLRIAQALEFAAFNAAGFFLPQCDSDNDALGDGRRVPIAHVVVTTRSLGGGGRRSGPGSKFTPIQVGREFLVRAARRLLPDRTIRNAQNATRKAPP